jgi:glycosyltransferase involved in cell wall biosynthesis
MRVLYFSRDLTTHDHRFVRAIRRFGAEVAYLRLETDGAGYTDTPLPAGVELVSWSGGGAPRPIGDAVVEYLPAYRDVVARLRPDLVQAGPVQSCGLIAALGGTAPLVLVSWGSDILVDARRDAWFQWATRAALRSCQGFLCDSPAVLSAARELSGAAPEALVLPWGLELSSYDRASAPQNRRRLRERLRWEECTVVLASRAWHPGYEVPRLVDAFAAAAARDSRLRLLLLGGGADEPAVRARITAHGIGARVDLPGMAGAADLRRALAAADVYASMVPSDGTSVSLLEAMLYELPVVVVQNPGNAEWVTPGETGWLVPAGDAEACAERLLELAAEPARARAMGARARRRVLERADWEANLPGLADLYERVRAR